MIGLECLLLNFKLNIFFILKLGKDYNNFFLFGSGSEDEDYDI